MNILAIAQNIDAPTRRLTFKSNQSQRTYVYFHALTKICAHRVECLFILVLKTRPIAHINLPPFHFRHYCILSLPPRRGACVFFILPYSLARWLTRENFRLTFFGAFGLFKFHSNKRRNFKVSLILKIPFIDEVFYITLDRVT